jgi:DNA-binding Lrp family transcriptional regulator
MRRIDRLDDIDLKIASLLLSGKSNSQMAALLKKPVSTIQRRSRRLLQSGIIEIKYELNYKRFGYKKGFLHIYLTNGDIYESAEKVRNLDHILSVSIHIGNSDVVAEYVCKDSGQLLELMAKIKKLPTVEKVVWSEEVSNMASPTLIPPLQDTLGFAVAN